MNDYLTNADLESAAAVLGDIASGLQAAATCAAESADEKSTWVARILACADAQWTYVQSHKSNIFEALVRVANAQQKEVLRTDAAAVSVPRPQVL